MLSMTYFIQDIDCQGKAGDHEEGQDIEDQRPVDRSLRLDGWQAGGSVRGGG
jgi:hypothetical protein